ncbi:TPA: hypothetical protein ACTTVN_003815, partial [Legionella anisa]
MKQSSVKEHIMMASIVGCFMLPISTMSFADSFNQSARLSHTNGIVSFLSAGIPVQPGAAAQPGMPAQPG